MKTAPDLGTIAFAETLKGSLKSTLMVWLLGSIVGGMDTGSGAVTAGDLRLATGSFWASGIWGGVRPSKAMGTWIPFGWFAVIMVTKLDGVARFGSWILKLFMTWYGRVVGGHSIGPTQASSWKRRPPGKARRLNWGSLVNWTTLPSATKRRSWVCALYSAARESAG